MAQYLILIYGDEAQWDARGDDEMRAVDAGHAAFRERGGRRSSRRVSSSRAAWRPPCAPVGSGRW